MIHPKLNANYATNILAKDAFNHPKDLVGIDDVPNYIQSIILIEWM